MARYIDADKLMNEIDELKKSPWYNNDYDGHKCARQEAVNIVVDLCIKSQPTADVQEEAVKDFSKSLIDKTNGGKISSTDIVDFTVDYLRGENND